MLSRSFALNNSNRTNPYPAVTDDESRIADARMQHNTGEGMKATSIFWSASIMEMKKQCSLRKQKSNFTDEELDDLKTITFGQKWRIHDVPEHYFLQRSSLRISKISLPKTVTQISSFLQMRSMKCVYSAESGRMVCSSPSMLKFVLQLWKCSDDKSAMILEVQRRRGCAVEMKNVRIDLFRTLLTGTYTRERAPNSKGFKMCQYDKQGKHAPRFSRLLSNQYDTKAREQLNPIFVISCI